MDEIKIRLKPSMREFVDQLLATGRYDAPDEIFWDALSLLREHEAIQSLRAEELRQAIAVGIEQADRGETEPLDMAEILAESQRRVAEESANGKAANPANVRSQK